MNFNKLIKSTIVIVAIALIVSCANTTSINKKLLKEEVEKFQLQVDLDSYKSVLNFHNEFELSNAMDVFTHYDLVDIAASKNFYFVHESLTDINTYYFYDSITSYYYILKEHDYSSTYSGTKQSMSLEEAIIKLNSIEAVNDAKSTLDSTYNFIFEMIEKHNSYYVVMDNNGRTYNIVDNKVVDEMNNKYSLMIDCGDLSYILTMDNERLVQFSPYVKNNSLTEIDSSLFQSSFIYSGKTDLSKVMTPLEEDRQNGTNLMDKFNVVEII